MALLRFYHQDISSVSTFSIEWKENGYNRYPQHESKKGLKTAIYDICIIIGSKYVPLTEDNFSPSRARAQQIFFLV